jgi:uncharacterized protein YkwD
MRAIYVSIIVAILSIIGYGLLITSTSRGVSVEPQVLAATTTSSNSVENSIISQINSIRQDVGVEAVTYSDDLKQLTNQRVSDMTTNNYYSHKSPNGTTYASYIKVFVPKSTFSCENLQLQMDADVNTAIEAWVNSPAHYKCLIDARLVNIAISYDVHSEIDTDDGFTPRQMYVFVMIASN